MLKVITFSIIALILGFASAQFPVEPEEGQPVTPAIETAYTLAVQVATQAQFQEPCSVLHIVTISNEDAVNMFDAMAADTALDVMDVQSFDSFVGKLTAAVFGFLDNQDVVFQYLYFWDHNILAQCAIGVMQAPPKEGV